MDFYLKNENTFERLFKEYKVYNSLVVAFDFDNTVYDFHQVGLDFKDVIKLLQNLKKIGCYLIVFTSTDDEDFVKRYCKEKEIPFDAINENPPFFKSKSRKIYYNILLDDRAGLREAYDHLEKLIHHLKNTNS
jgi:DNA-binding LacI/PurR family transcriptional regulator